MANQSNQKTSKYDPAAEDKARPVRVIHFWSLSKWPGIGGAGMGLGVGAKLPSNYLACDSIFLYRGEFVVNGQYFMDKKSAGIQSYEF